MIQLSAMPSAPGTANMAEFLGNGDADAGESANFGALLAVQIGAEPVLPAPAIAAIPAPALPDTGKILPPIQLDGLPDAMPPVLARTVLTPGIAAPAIEADTAPMAGTKHKATQPAPLTLPCTFGTKAKAMPGTRSAPAPETTAQAVEAEPSPQSQAGAPMLITAVQSGPALHAPAQHDPAHQSLVQHELAPIEMVTSAPVSPLVPPVLSRAKPVEASGRHTTHQFDPPQDQAPVQPQVQPRHAIAPAPALTAQPAAAALPELPIAFAEALLAAPAHAQPLARAPINLRLRAASAANAAQSGTAAPIVLAGKPGDAPALVFEPLLGKPALPSNGPFPREGAASPPTAPQPGEPASTAPAMAPVRPLDFAGLVDRLVQARDAAAPQTVSLALNHAEFGKISLRFEQDGTGLSVGMTSPDPDFARAVSAAMPPERTSSAEQHQGGQSSRHDTSGSDLPGQSRGGSNPERRDERGALRPDPAQTARRHADKQGRGEIFA